MGTGYRVLSEWRMFPRVASVLRTIFNDTPWRFKMLGDSCHTKSSFLSQLLHTVILNKHPASEFRIIYSKLQICKNNPTTSRCCIHYYLSKRLDLDLWTFVPTILQPQTQRRLHSSVRIARRSKPFAANWKRFQYLTSWWSWDGSTHQTAIAQKKCAHAGGGSLFTGGTTPRLDSHWLDSKRSIEKLPCLENAREGSAPFLDVRFWRQLFIT